MNEDQRACFDCGRPIPILEIRCKLCFVRFVDAHPGMEVYGANLQAKGNPRGGGHTQASQGTELTIWRQGSKIPLNIYEGDRPVCQCHNPEDARRIVDAVNGQLSPLAAASEELYLALEELRAWNWRGVGRTPAERGAKCQTWTEVTEKVDAALAHARGEKTK